MAEWYEGLRLAILQRAAQDYITALVDDDERVINEVERFFRSEWGELLSGEKGELIIAECRKRAGVIERGNNETFV